MTIQREAKRIVRELLIAHINKRGRRAAMFRMAVITCQHNRTLVYKLSMKSRDLAHLRRNIGVT